MHTKPYFIIQCILLIKYYNSERLAYCELYLHSTFQFYTVNESLIIYDYRLTLSLFV